MIKTTPCLICLLVLALATQAHGQQGLQVLPSNDTQRHPDEPPSPEILASLTNHCQALAASRDGKLVILGERHQTLRVVNSHDFSTYRQLVGHDEPGWQWACFSADQRYIMTIGWDGKSPMNARDTQEMSAVEATVYSAFAWRGPNLLRRWDLTTGELVDQKSLERSSIFCLAHSPTAAEFSFLAITQTSDGQTEASVHRFDSNTFQSTARHVLPRDFWTRGSLTPSSLQYSTDGERVVVHGEEYRVVISCRTGQIEDQTRLIPDGLHGSRLVAVSGTEVWRGRMEMTPPSYGWRLTLDGYDLKSKTRIRSYAIDLGRDVQTTNAFSSYGVYALQVKPDQLLLSVERSKGWQSFVVDRSSGRITSSRFPLRYDLALPDGNVVSGGVLCSSEGRALATVNDRTAGVEAPVETSIVRPAEMGWPIRASADGRYILYENDASFTVWNVEQKAVSRTYPRSANALPFDPGRAASALIRSQADYDTVHQKFLVATPLQTTWSRQEFGRNLGKATMAGGDTLDSAIVLRKVNNATIQLESLRYSGYRWAFQFLDPERSDPEDVPLDVAGPAVSLTYQNSKFSCVYIAPDRRTFRLVTLAHDAEPVQQDIFQGNGGSLLRYLTLMRLEHPSLFGAIPLGAFRPTLAISTVTDKEVELVARDSFALRVPCIIRRSLVDKELQIVELKAGENLVLSQQGASDMLNLGVSSLSESTRQVAVIRMGIEEPYGLLGAPSSAIGRGTSQSPIVDVYDADSGRRLRSFRVPDTLMRRVDATHPGGQAKGVTFTPITCHFADDDQRLCLSVLGSPLIHAAFDIKTGGMTELIASSSAWELLPNKQTMVDGQRVHDLTRAGQSISLTDYHPETMQAVPQVQAETPLAASAEQSGSEQSVRYEPCLWYLGIGVDTYTSESIPNLKFCERDARAIDQQLAKTGTNQGVKYVPSLLLDGQATVTRVEEALQSLERTVATQDTIVITFSGHGVRGQRGLYLLTREASLTGLHGSAVNWETLAAAIERLKAKRILVFLDTCHAGAFSESNLEIQTQFRERLSAKSGVLVLASSQGQELSEEVAQHDHGAFSLAVLEALKGLADRDDDGRLKLGELTRYVQTRVAALTNDRQHPTAVVRQISDDDLIFDWGIAP